ncbi:MAG: acyl-CoA thioesterase [Desulfovibrio sp.]|nr:acyl-CoA thioesterase [Desulfovibrio sp.]MBI4958669.1 acyl-CoA thioesterase [Desulfovibrio sp.]
MDGVKVSDTRTDMPVRMLPQDANPAGNVHGGVILRQIDLVGGIVATRYARSRVVTASVDRVDFLAPVKVGEVMVLKSCVNFVGSTSMEVGIRVEAEDMLTGETRHAATAYMTFVAMDESGKPGKLPPLILETPEDRRRFDEAEQRRAVRKEERRRERTG